MTFKVTVLEYFERFATLVDGELTFWEVGNDGNVIKVDGISALNNFEDWTLNSKE